MAHGLLRSAGYVRLLGVGVAVPESCEPMVRDLSRIRLSMTRAEVMAIMKPYKVNFSDDDGISFRHSDESAHKADSASVMFSTDGRVISTNFTPD